MATRAIRNVEPGITILELSGRLNVGSNLSGTEAEILGLIRAGSRKLILDCSKLDYIDSASIGALIGCDKEMKEAGGQIRIAGAQGTVGRTFQLIHMDKIVAVDADVDTAQKTIA